ncbi:MAG: chemotaxis protein CheA [Myxococcota bacterium]
MDLEKYRLLFVDEATEHLAEMSRALVHLERSDAHESVADAIDTLFRMTHSIKGMAASLDYDPLSTLAHSLEDWLEPRREDARLPAASLPLLYDVIRALERMVEEVDRGAAPPVPREDLIARLAAPSVDAPPSPSVSDASLAPPLPRSVRIRTGVVDRFLAEVGELVQRQSRLEALQRESPLWQIPREFTDELEGMARVVRELRRRVLDMRTTPLRRVFERLPRVASELARELDKRVRVELSGDECEADRAVVDHLADPLLHLVRNAVGHGLEAPAEREAAGKSPVGEVRVAARTAGGRLVVELVDDGRGIDIERVRRRAIERGRLLEEVAEDLTPEQVCELIFEPGISTSPTVTALSGRGVGLDAVKRAIESLGGSIRVESLPAQGTRFEIELSSMAALQRVLVVEIGGERIALPVDPLEAVVPVEEGSVERAGSESFFVWKDDPIPMLDLAERLGLPTAPEPSSVRGHVLIGETRGFRLALRVDRAASDLEVFVREVPPLLSGLQPLGGLAILPDGIPVFLIELSVLVESFL